MLATVTESPRSCFETMADSVQNLVDRAEIHDCVIRYCRGQDRLDADLVRSAYHEDAVDDHVAFVGGVEGLIDWSFSQYDDLARHQHFVMNHHAEIDGDAAHAETYYIFTGAPTGDGPFSMTGGRYVDRFERRDGRWAIAARSVVVEWMTQTPSLLGPAAYEAMADAGTVARDRTDVSYARPLRVREPDPAS